MNSKTYGYGVFLDYYASGDLMFCETAEDAHSLARLYVERGFARSATLYEVPANTEMVLGVVGQVPWTYLEPRPKRAADCILLGYYDRGADGQAVWSNPDEQAET